MDTKKNGTGRKISKSGFSYLLGITVLCCIYFLRNKSYSVDDSFITYRYAFNLKNGFGLVFNAGESYYGTTAAGYAILLASLSRACDLVYGTFLSGIIAPSIQVISVAISSVSLWVVAVLLPYLFCSKGNSIKLLIAFIFSFYLFTGYSFNEVAGHETYTFLATALLSTILVADKSYVFAGLLLAVSTTFRPDTILFLPILLILDWKKSLKPATLYLRSANLLKFAIGFLGILLPWVIYLWIHFGQPIPGTMDAKRAQVALGYWPIYSPENLLKYVFSTVDPLPLFIIGLGLAGFIWCCMQVNRIGEILIDRGRFIAITWLLFGVGSASAYFLFHVTFWRWYGIPIVFSLGVVALIGWRTIIDQFISASQLLKENRKLSSFMIYSPLIFMAIVISSGSVDFINWIKNKNINLHIYAYSDIADYLMQEEPDGAVVQMFEPGSFGYRLGPKFKVVDELGLISPGVAKALLRGDTNFAMKTYSPKYLVCSWRGSYSECEKPNLNENFELVGEFNSDFWGPQIGHGARLFRRSSGAINPAYKSAATVNDIILGDKWGKVEKIGNSSEWFIHPGQTTDTTFNIVCSKNCSGKYWAHIAALPKEVPEDTGDVMIKIRGKSNQILFEGVVNRRHPLPPVVLKTGENIINVSVNNNGKPDYDWLVFGFEVSGQ